MSIQITEEQAKVFNLLLKKDKPLSVREICAELSMDQPFVTGTVSFGEQQKWVTITENLKEELVPAENLSSLIKKGLPERQFLTIISEKKEMKMQDVSAICRQNNIEMKDIIKWGFHREWFVKDKGNLNLSPTGEKYINQQDEDEKTLTLLAEKGALYLDQISEPGIDLDRVKKLLSHRTEFVKIKPRNIRIVSLTDTGKNSINNNIQVKSEKNQYSSEDISSGAWKDIKLRSYDVTLEAEKVHPAKIHPLQKILQQTRQVFLEMGFEEIVSPQVESAFWDFDALFQPQDHPARDMQDTFYMQQPEKANLPNKEWVNNVKATHEDGGDTGSCGWGYKWNSDRARKVVLRTHTTAATVRALAKNPNPPRKVFCVGRVFRNEAVSYKHLPEFHQVDGIILDKDGNLSTLLGTLTEFYRKMGFTKVKFKPDFFPYTEPSAEVSVWMPQRNNWIELGGSGIFRPEVTRPLGCNVPVLAWGLGLERLAMLRYGFKDIRELYWNDLDKLNEVPLCR